ncbi:MAG: right-handed parallel beta-helix repeat-containing protein, partial [Chthoniobacterales bacterium]
MITRTTISGNSLVAVNGGNDGGGIEAFGNLNLIDSIVTSNSSPNNGGGIYVSADAAVSISGSTISDNTANSDQMGEGAGVTGNGGGIYASLGSHNTSGIMTITDTTINDNRTLSGGPNEKFGGGIFTEKQMNMTNCTVSGNSAEGGSGIYIVYIDTTDGMVNVTNSTIANNTATGQGGGLIFIRTFDNGATVNLRNSLIANNTAGLNPDLDGAFNSQGYNLIEDTTGATFFGDTTGNITGQDPNLGPLQDNGGMTFTHALLPGSPAIDKGKSADVMTDQRALPRPYNYPSIPNATGGDGSDIGAFEDQPPNTTPGNDVTVEAPAGDASVTFDSVTLAGFTTFGEIVPPSSAGAPPPGYTILDDAPAYDINTTATYTAPITVCFTVNSITDVSDFARVRVLHGEDGQLVDRTVLDSLDFASRTVCAEVDSLSPFVIALAPSNTLLNISTRLRVQTGDNVMIGGFIVTGSAPKTVIVRAIGPSLPVPDKLANPTLELFGPSGLIASNDDWMDAPNKQEIIDSNLAPTNDLESAILTTLPGGTTAYTAIVRGAGEGTGVGLVEVYDLNATDDSELANISTRGFVQTGDNIMIGGFILGGGAGDATVLVRGVGPS